MVTHFISFIESNIDFYLIPLTNYKVDDDITSLAVQLLHKEKFTIKLLSIDYVIFNILKKPILYSDFIENGKKFLDDDFPTNEIENFIETLWKRISIFISYGIFHPVKIESYKNIVQ